MNSQLDWNFEKKILADLFPDARIEVAPAPTALDKIDGRGVLWQAARNRFLLEVPEVARFMVEGGSRITIDAAPESAVEDIRRFLRMTPLAALCFQRGIPAFHAAAISIADQDECVLLAGDSGAGKSVLLTGLLKRGARLLADELSIVHEDVSGRLTVIPTFPEVILWPDGAKKSGFPFPGEKGPRTVDYASQMAAGPLTLKSIYHLSVSTRDQIEFSEVAALERVPSLGRLTYNSHIAEELFDRLAYFSMITRLAQAVPIYRLRRPKGRWCVEELVDRVIGNI